MRPPAHILSLEQAGSSFAELTAFRRQLEGFRITVCWNPNLKVWILGKVPRTGPTFISLKVGLLALVDLMQDPRAVARQFEAIEEQSANLEGVQS